MIELLIGAWILCGVVAYGLCFAFFQEKYPEIAVSGRRADRALATFIGLVGPIGLFTALLSYWTNHRRLSLRYRSLPAEQSWAAHQRRFPSLSRKDWANN